MTPLDFIFWGLELILEAIGAEWAGRRKIWPLCAYLYFRVAADIACFSIYIGAGQNAFYWADWWQRAIQYPLMAVLLAYAIGNVLHENLHLQRFYAAVFSGVVITGIAFYGFLGILTSARLLRIELSANMLLCSILCLALAMRKEVKSPWGAISAGILIQVGSEALLTTALLRGFTINWPLHDGWVAAFVRAWNQAVSILTVVDPARLYPLGAIAALGMWVWAVRPKWKVSEARLSLGAKF